MTSVPVRIVIFVLVLGPTFFTFAWFWLYHNNVKFHPTVRVVDQADLGYLLLSLLPVAAITVINSLSDISIQAALHRCQALDLNHSLQNIWRPRFEVLKHLKKRYTILGNPWSVGDILIALFIFLLNLYLWSLPVVTGLLGPKTSDPMWLQVLGMFAHSALPGMWDAGLAIAFAIRENYIVKSVAGAEAGQFHTGIRFHIALGYISFFLISFHCLFFIVFYSVNGVFAASMFPWLSTLGYSNGTGFISWVAMIIMVATSIYKARRRNYRLFAWTHKLYVIFILFAASHMGIRCIYPVLSAIVLFIFDRLSAHLRTKRQAHALISQTTSESIVKVDIPILPGWKSTSRYAPGDWISIQVPSISSDWHPFSIASYNLDTPDRMTLFVRVHGRWTQALNDIVAVEDDVLVPVNVDGPFGSRRTSYLAFDNLMLVGAGTGIGALIPFMRHFVVAASPQAKIHLVWMAKKETDILVYWRLLSDLSNPNSSLFGRVKVHLHFTKQPPKAKTPVLQKKSYLELVTAEEADLSDDEAFDVEDDRAYEDLVDVVGSPALSHRSGSKRPRSFVSHKSAPKSPGMAHKRSFVGTPRSVHKEFPEFYDDYVETSSTAVQPGMTPLVGYQAIMKWAAMSPPSEPVAIVLDDLNVVADMEVDVAVQSPPMALASSSKSKTTRSLKPIKSEGILSPAPRMAATSSAATTRKSSHHSLKPVDQNNSLGLGLAESSPGMAPRGSNIHNKHSTRTLRPIHDEDGNVPSTTTAMAHRRSRSILDILVADVDPITSPMVGSNTPGLRKALHEIMNFDEPEISLDIKLFSKRQSLHAESHHSNPYSNSPRIITTDPDDVGVHDPLEQGAYSPETALSKTTQASADTLLAGTPLTDPQRQQLPQQLPEKRFRSPRSAQVILAVAVFGMAAVGFVFGRLIQPGFDMNTCTGTDAYLTQGLTHFVCFYWFNWAAEVLACVFALAGGRLVILVSNYIRRTRTHEYARTRIGPDSSDSPEKPEPVAAGTKSPSDSKEYILSLVDDNLDAGIPISALNHIPESINWFSGRPDFAKILGDIVKDCRGENEDGDGGRRESSGPMSPQSTSSAARVLSKKRAAPIAVMGAGPEAMMRQLQHLVVTTEDAHWFRESWKV